METQKTIQERKHLRKPSKELLGILSHNIKSYREANKLSQEKLADICELHRTYIGAVERGERNITLSTLEVIAKALDTDIKNLLSDGEL